MTFNVMWFFTSQAYSDESVSWRIRNRFMMPGHSLKAANSLT